MSEKKDNLDLWRRVEKTDPNHQKSKDRNGKQIKLDGVNITTVDPQYQIENVTREFGVFGIDWGIEESTITPLVIPTPDGGEEVTLFYKAKLFFTVNGDRMYSTAQNSMKFRYFVRSKGYFKTDDSAVKKVETDTLTKHFSRMGFNADIFKGKYDDVRYIEELREEFAQKAIIEKVENEIKKADTPKFDAQYFIEKINEAPNINTLGSIWKAIPAAMKAECLQAKDSRKIELT